MNWKHIFPQLQQNRGKDLDFFSKRALFSSHECVEIIGFTKTLEKQKSSFSWGENEKNIRDTDLYWLYPNETNYWLFERVAWAVHQYNSEIFGFDLDGTLSGFQLGCYGLGQGYDWHADLGRNSPRRKLTVVIQLSDPSGYKGGKLQFFRTGEQHAEADISQGSITVFPSWLMHRVTKISAGTRWSLVAWIEGTPFR